MKIEIELHEHDLRKLVIDDIQNRLGNIDFNEKDIHIEVKSKLNFKAEWEEAQFRARIIIV